MPYDQESFNNGFDAGLKKGKQQGRNLSVFMVISFIAFGILALYSAFYVSSLNCTDLIITNNEFSLCDAFNLEKAQNLIEYCADLPNGDFFTGIVPGV